MVHPQCDLEVELMQKERKHEVLSKGYVPKFEKDLDIVKQIVNIHKPLLTDQTPFEDQIKEQLRMWNFHFLYCVDSVSKKEVTRQLSIVKKMAKKC